MKAIKCYVVFTRPVIVRAWKHQDGNDIPRICEFGEGNVIPTYDEFDTDDKDFYDEMDDDMFELRHNLVCYLPMDRCRIVTVNDLKDAWRSFRTVEGVAESLKLKENQVRRWLTQLRCLGVNL